MSKSKQKNVLCTKKYLYTKHIKRNQANKQNYNQLKTKTTTKTKTNRKKNLLNFNVIRREFI